MISLFLILAISKIFAYAARIPWQGLLQGALASPPCNSDPQIPINNSSLAELRNRQVTSFESTCGYNTGNPDEPRTANSGFDCRIDTLHGLWGFCPTTVISATDCGLAGNCVDSYSCTSGCGIFGTPSITTFTCSGTAAPFCLTVLLTEGIDQTYSYIACGPTAVTDHLLAEPTTASSVSATTQSSSASPAASTSAVPSTTTTTTASESTTSSQSTGITSQETSSLSTTTNVPSSTSALSSSSTASTTGTSTPHVQNSNLGAIVGGGVGGTAVICFFILGILFLRKYRRDHNEDHNTQSPKRHTWWQRGYRTTEMQTAGLHEIDGDVPNRYEKYGRSVHENEGIKYERHESIPSMPQVHTAYELPE